LCRFYLVSKHVSNSIKNITTYSSEFFFTLPAPAVLVIVVMFSVAIIIK
jgi:hypothetical protein